jgi:hypothetical protein
MNHFRGIQRSKPKLSRHADNSEAIFIFLCLVVVLAVALVLYMDIVAYGSHLFML